MARLDTALGSGRSSGGKPAFALWQLAFRPFYELAALF